MTTILIYDENNLDSVLTAACLASFRNFKVSEAKSIPDADADKYIWIGVYPLKTYFPFEKSWESHKKEHVAFVNVPENAKRHPDTLPGVSFLFSGEEIQNFQYASVYGQKSYLERLLGYLNIDPELFINTSLMIESFYKKETSQELLWLTCLNVKEALYCLETGEPYSSITMNAEVLQDARHCFMEYDRKSRRVIDRRGVYSDVTCNKGEKYKYYSYYEHSDWWFIRRRFFREGIVIRNISVSVTGTIIISNTAFMGSVEHLNPVFVL